jgi:UDP-glucose 4-epimerase
MKSAFITGGAGFIGSVTAALFREQGWRVTIYDDLSRGHVEALPDGALFVKGDIRERDSLVAALRQAEPDCVLHFAALAYVGESFASPSRYFEVNVGGTATLAAAMAKSGARRIVFSSSCTVYGEPDYLPIDEKSAVKPAVSPYGQSKQSCETMLDWMSRTADFSVCSLRYFNAAGAWEERGEDHSPETHLIPLVIDVALGRRPHLDVFGDDYPTADGTCVRDYVHIRDLATAHLAAAELLLRSSPGTMEYVNLGAGRGYSVLEVVQAVERITGRRVPVRVGGRRSGDAPELVAAAGKARKLLGWHPVHSDLDEIVELAWRWRIANPHGYE